MTTEEVLVEGQIAGKQTHPIATLGEVIFVIPRYLLDFLTSPPWGIDLRLAFLSLQFLSCQIPTTILVTVVKKLR